MRGPSKSLMWREWMIRVVGESISMQAFVHPDVENEARCLGFASTFRGNPDFKGNCVIPPYGNALFLNSSRDDPAEGSQAWKIRQPDGTTGQFEIVASHKPDGCLRTLAVEDCSNQPVLVEDSPPYLTETTKYRSWTLVRKYDVVPKPSPSATLPSPTAPPLSSSPSPPSPVPGPVISASSSTLRGSVNVLVHSNGGNSECSVSSITLKTTGSYVGSLPRSVEVSASRGGLSSVGVSVPLPQVGKNTVYAVGMCRNGGKTERSNEVSVFRAAPGGVPSPPPPPPLVNGWFSQTSAANNDWVGVTWGGPAGQEKFVAVAYSGTGNRVMTSATGL